MTIGIHHHLYYCRIQNRSAAMFCSESCVLALPFLPGLHIFMLSHFSCIFGDGGSLFSCVLDDGGTLYDQIMSRSVGLSHLLIFMNCRHWNKSEFNWVIGVQL